MFRNFITFPPTLTKFCNLNWLPVMPAQAGIHKKRLSLENGKNLDASLRWHDNVLKR